MKYLFDFLKYSQPVNHIMQEIVILSPYPSCSFINDIKNIYKPKKISLIVDLASKHLVKEIINDHKEIKISYVSTKNGKGQVHSKLYLVKWKKKGFKSSKHVLFLGSANASKNGFYTNSETLLAIPFSKVKKIEHIKIIKYFSNLKNNKDNSKKIINFDKLGILWLPKTVSAKNEDLLDFSGWIKQGVLCHKYDSENTFGKLTITLKNPLPKTPQESKFSDRGFFKKIKKKKLSRNYINLSSTKSTSPWKATYFTETWYGHWASYECFDDASNNKILNSRNTPIKFSSSDSKERRLALTEIINSRKYQREKWKKECFSKLVDVYEDLQSTEADASKYLKTKYQDLDEEYYLLKLEDKLKRDKQKTKVKSFCERFITGYQFYQVPPFDNTDNEFIIGFCDSILSAGLKSRVVNKLAFTLKELLGEKFVAAEDGEELYKLIEDEWDNIKKKVMAYHEPMNKI